MYTDYLFYLSTLAEAERNKQILTIILIFTVMLAIGGIHELLEYKFGRNTKNNKDNNT